jgi:dihydropyrimidinase
MSYETLVDLLAGAPARTFGLPKKGRIEPGADADLVVFDPDEQYTISADDNHSEADYSVYEGREVTGRVKKTLVRGTVVAADGEILAEPGYGEFLARDVPDWG